jgi:hypothetical protein
MVIHGVAQGAQSDGTERVKIEFDKDARKNLALRIQSVCGKSDMGRFSALLYKNMLETVDIKKYLMEFDGRDLYEILTAKAKKNR